MKELRFKKTLQTIFLAAAEEVLSRNPKNLRHPKEIDLIFFRANCLSERESGWTESHLRSCSACWAAYKTLETELAGPELDRKLRSIARRIAVASLLTEVPARPAPRPKRRPSSKVNMVAKQPPASRRSPAAKRAS